MNGYEIFKLTIAGSEQHYPTDIYLFKASIGNTRTMWKSVQSSKDTRKTTITSFWCLYC